MVPQVQLSILLFLLVACSMPPHGASDRASATSESGQSLDQCSTMGMMACQAMALISRDSVPTCTVYAARGGSRIEACGYVPSGGPTSPGASPAGHQVYPVHLAWSDNSDNESNFIIERCDQVQSASKDGTATCTGTWRTVATVSANTTKYIDNTAAVNQSYIYRVKAVNSQGSSGYTQEAVITTPSR
jgi:hypothetical protein